MSTDINIRGNDFNRKFKNMLRDCYVYQFKQESDHRHKATDEKVKPGTFNLDYSRVRAIIEHKAGITWSKKGTDKKCVTIDGRYLQKNPFHELYAYSSEIGSVPGYDFALTYLLLVYFCPEISNQCLPALTEDDVQLLDRTLKKVSCSSVSEFDDLAQRQKEKKAGNNLSCFLRAVELSLNPRLTDKEKCLLKDSIGMMPSALYHNESGFRALAERLFFSGQEIYFDGSCFNIRKRKSLSKKEIETLIDRYEIIIDARTLGNRLAQLVELGILKKNGAGNKTTYEISNLFLRDLFPREDDITKRFSEMIAFFSQQSNLGSIGTRLLNRLPKCTQYIYYRHNYLQRTLNSYNMVDLLYAIKHKLWVGIEYRNAAVHNLKYNRLVCYPMEIRESVVNGRQYLVYYHPVYRSVSAVRIEFIDRVIIGKCDTDAHFQADTERAQKLIDNTWGLYFGSFKEGNVKDEIVLGNIRMILKIEAGKDHVLQRLKQELRLQPEEHGNCVEVNVRTASPGEMLPWLSTFVSQIVLIEKDGVPWNEVFQNAEYAYDMYFDPEDLESIPIDNGPPRRRPIIMDDNFNLLRSKQERHSLLFHEYVGHAFDSLGRLLFEILPRDSIDEDTLNKMTQKCVKEYFSLNYHSPDMTEAIRKEVYGHVKEQIDTFTKVFLKESGDYSTSCHALNGGHTIQTAIDMLPLTTAEIQWLRNILSNPLAECFLSVEEKDSIMAKLPEQDLFDVNIVQLYDQFKLDDELRCCKTVPLILKAIRSRKRIRFEYISQIENNVCPVHLEYSKRNNRFYLYAVIKRGAVKIFCADQMKNIEETDHKYDYDDAKSKVNSYKTSENHLKIVTVRFNETNNTADRILTEFSCYRKDCIRSHRGGYEMTLYYEKDVAKEIASRLLRYGPYIFISDDTGSVKKIICSKLRDQLNLTRTIEQNKDSKSADEPVRG